MPVGKGSDAPPMSTRRSRVNTVAGMTVPIDNDPSSSDDDILVGAVQNLGFEDFEEDRQIKVKEARDPAEIESAEVVEAMSLANISVYPPVVEIQDIEPGVKYVMSVIVQNVASRTQRVRILPPPPGSGFSIAMSPQVWWFSVRITL